MDIEQEKLKEIRELYRELLENKASRRDEKLNSRLLQNIIEQFVNLYDELEAKEKEIREKAIRDPLTGVYNRITFDESLKQEIEEERRYKDSIFSLIMFDIDHFKHVNDEYGHPAGDRVLQELAELVQKKVRKVDIFARWGGEEFIILAPRTDSKQAYQTAERLRKSIEEYNFISEENITCSFGAAQYKQGESEENLLERVDQALYKAKKSGRNQTISAESMREEKV